MLYEVITNPPIIISDNEVLADFCGLYNFFNYNSGLYTGTDLVDISGNLVNPSIQDISYNFV